MLTNRMEDIAYIAGLHRSINILLACIVRRDFLYYPEVIRVVNARKVQLLLRSCALPPLCWEPSSFFSLFKLRHVLCLLSALSKMNHLKFIRL